MKNLSTLTELVAELRRIDDNHPNLANTGATTALQTAISNVRFAIGEYQKEAARAVEHPGAAGLAGLSGLVSLVEPAAEATAPRNGVTHALSDSTSSIVAEAVTDDDYDEYDEPRPAEVIVVAAEFTDWRSEPDLKAALDVALASFSERWQGYEIEPNSLTATGAVLVAPDGQGLPTGTAGGGGSVLFKGAFPEHGVVLSFTVAGEEGEPRDPEVETARRLQEAAELGEPVPEVTEVHVVVTRLDGEELTTDAARTPLERAVLGLAAVVGPHELVEIVDDAPHSPASKVGVLRPTGAGSLDRRALAVGAAFFEGVLAFDGLGRVRATAKVV